MKLSSAEVQSSQNRLSFNHIVGEAPHTRGIKVKHDTGLAKFAAARVADRVPLMSEAINNTEAPSSSTILSTAISEDASPPGTF